MEFHQQTIHLVQCSQGIIGEIRFRYGLWQFVPCKNVEINGEQMAQIAQQIKGIEDSEGTECLDCEGTGGEVVPNGNHPGMITCRRCKGSGGAECKQPT